MFCNKAIPLMKVWSKNGENAKRKSVNPFNPIFLAIWTCYMAFPLVYTLRESYISEQQMWSPPKFATAFPKSSRCQIPKHKRHRNSLLVGLQRSPLSGPSSFLVTIKVYVRFSKDFWNRKAYLHEISRYVRAIALKPTNFILAFC